MRREHVTCLIVIPPAWFQEKETYFVCGYAMNVCILRRVPDTRSLDTDTDYSIKAFGGHLAFYHLLKLSIGPTYLC